MGELVGINGEPIVPTRAYNVNNVKVFIHINGKEYAASLDVDCNDKSVARQVINQLVEVIRNTYQKELDIEDTNVVDVEFTSSEPEVIKEEL